MTIVLTDLVSQQLLQAISSTILHSVWQVPLIAIIMAMILKQGKNRSATYRYNLSFASLLLVLISSCFTFAFYFLKGIPFDHGQSAGFISISQQLPSILNQITSPNQTIMDLVNDHIFRIAWIWIIGVILFSTRLLAGGIYLHHLKRRLDYEIPESIHCLVKEITEKFSIKKNWRVALTDRIDIPILIGHVKPVVVLPIAAINGLSMSEVETILAHEMAHLVRNDFVQNIVVLGIENIFFYHPVVWWMSSVLKTERENCCDDCVIHYYPDKMKYAKTLIKLQDIRQSHPTNLAMSLFNNKKSLMKRIKRILNQSYSTNPLREKILATSMFILAVISLGSAHNFIHLKESPIPFLLIPQDIDVKPSFGEEIASMYDNISLPVSAPGEVVVHSPNKIARHSGPKQSLNDKATASPKTSVLPVENNHPTTMPLDQNSKSGILTHDPVTTDIKSTFMTSPLVANQDTTDKEEYIRQREIVRQKVREIRDKARAQARELREKLREYRALSRENMDEERAQLREERERLEDQMHKMSKEQREELKEELKDMKELKDLEKSKFRKHSKKWKKNKDNRDDEDHAAYFEAFTRDLEVELESLLDTDWVQDLTDMNGELASELMARIDGNLEEDLAAFGAEFNLSYDEDWSKELARIGEELGTAVTDWVSDMELDSKSKLFSDLAKSSGNYESGLKTALFQELVRDGLLRDNRNNKVRLTNDTFKINGKSQTEALSAKYRTIVTEFVTDAFSGKTSIELKMDGKELQNSGKTVLSITIEK